VGHNKFRIPVIITGIIVFYIVIHYFFFPSNPFVPGLSSINNLYLLLTEKFANAILHWTGFPVKIINHKILLNNNIINGFIPETLYKKWTLILLLFFWLTKTSFRRKMFFTVLLLIVHFLLVSLHIAIGARLVSLGMVDTIFPSASLTFGVMSMITILFVWYWKNKDFILHSLQKLKINTQLLESKFTVIIVLTYLYAVIGFFLLYAFDYQWWINFLFVSARKILSVIGYDASVEHSLLIGNNGSIYMAKYCLGFKTMLLFASLVYLTGNDNKRRWIYIIIGLIFLNFVNIMRFVLLFIHIQKHGGYTLSMDLHDMYKYITYTIVFILWVIWFEKFSDIEPFHKYKNVHKQ